jgi:predicted ATPase
MVLVVGDAGVGKTTFAGVGMDRAAAAGMVVLRGGCLPVAGSLPLLPVVAALDALARLDGGGLLETALDAAPAFVRGELGRLLPRLGPGDETAAAGRGGEWWRERMFAGLTELLDAVAQRASVGLVVEDVHWTDSETLDFLTFPRAGGPGCGDGGGDVPQR